MCKTLALLHEGEESQNEVRHKNTKLHTMKCSFTICFRVVKLL